MDNQLKLTERELNEIKLALIYDEQFRHGTDVHNRLVLLAKLARFVGFNLDKVDTEMSIPETILVDAGPDTPPRTRASL